MDEWLAFWEIVKKSGYTEKEITEEVIFLKNIIMLKLDELIEGKAWVQFKKVDQFIRND